MARLRFQPHNNNIQTSGVLTMKASRHVREKRKWKTIAISVLVLQLLELITVGILYARHS